MSDTQIPKTYKLFIGGKFPRSESGRVAPMEVSADASANVCVASKKDLRDAVSAARAAHSSWASRTPYNRGQILYRIGEMLSARRDAFAHVMNPATFDDEFASTLDEIVHVAGWADKLGHVAGTVNPVSSPHFVFSLPDSVGVVAAVAPSEKSLLGAVSLIVRAIVSGNTMILLASESDPVAALELAEVLSTSDVPAGVVNILSGQQAELLPVMAAHMDINSLDLTGVQSRELATSAEQEAAVNVKRTLDGTKMDTLQHVLALTETKTVWHPIGV